MASAEHLELAEFIKSVHSNLRRASQKLGPKEAWEQHCQNEDILKQYAQAMHTLASEYWENNYNESTKAISRIKWIYNYIQYYFMDELLRQRQREIEIADKLGLEVAFKYEFSCNNLKLLDVGSCYNPFKDFDCFDVLAIDLAPATESVYECDFLNLNITDQIERNENGKVTGLKKLYYDVIVFSFLLEYMPSPKQRLLSCANAFELLKDEGILVIITPDSKHVGANAKIMKSWRYILSKLGYSRIKYEKLPYMHCIVFRKSLKREIAQRWAEIYKSDEFYEELVIPQDFNSVNVNF